jgi:N-acetylglucosaminyldiphosphoundecaprenol N-acetyl-beta-D-mannosaminyltransferase
MFGMRIDKLRMHEAVEKLPAWIAADDGRCRYVVTPNVDHTVMYEERADLKIREQGSEQRPTSPR